MSDGINRETSWKFSNPFEDSTNLEEPEANFNEGINVVISHQEITDVNNHQSDALTHYFLNNDLKGHNPKAHLHALNFIAKNFKQFSRDELDGLLNFTGIKDTTNLEVRDKINEIEQMIDFEDMTQLSEMPAGMTLEEKSAEIDSEHPSIIFKDALNDMQEVIKQGARKHGAGSWREKDNPSLQHKANSDSMFHHLAEHFNGVDIDVDSGVDPLLHLACRALMRYTRKKRGK